MTNQIGNLISTLFYDGKLKNGRTVDSQNSVVWIDYEPTQAWPLDNSIINDKPKIYNINECEITHHLLLDLNTRSSKNTMVAIITPYKHQVFMMKKYLRFDEYNNLNINIDTVDGFQGKECDVVIFSLTRTTGTYRFLADDRRLNVALSRARDNLYIVGNMNYAKRNLLLDRIIQSSRILGCKFDLYWQ